MFLENNLIYFISAFTSVAVFFLAIRRLGMKTALLNHALREVIQCIGAFIVFFVLNLTVGGVAIFVIRGFWRFFPLYTLADVGLLVISAFQGFVFHLWWRLSQKREM
jgi:hypothetical protein